MVPQPYPLFYGRPRGGELEIGRVVGWHQPGAGNEPEHLRPVVLFANPDGTAGRLARVELDGAPCWIKDSEEALVAAFEVHEKLARIKDLTR